MNNDISQLIKTLEQKKRTLTWNRRARIILSTLCGVYFLAWVMRAAFLLMHSIPLSLSAACLWLTPGVIIFHFLLACIRQKKTLTGVMVTQETASCSWNHQVRLLWLFPLSAASFLIIELVSPFLLTLHFAATPFAYTAAIVISLLCLICFIQTISSTFSTGRAIPVLSTSKRLDSWSQGCTPIQHPFSTPYTKSFVSALIEKIKDKQGSSANKTLPLEWALGFIDSRIFAECMQCYDPSSRDYQDSCQAVRKILTPFLHASYNLEVKTLSVLQAILATLPPPAAPPSLSSKLPVHPLPFLSPNKASDHHPNALSYSPNPAYTLPQSLAIALPFPASRFPSLLKTLQKIPLPVNNQIAYLLNHKKFCKFSRTFLPAIRLNNCVDRNVPSLFQTLSGDAQYQSIRKAFHAIRDQVSFSRANSTIWPRQLATPLARSDYFGRLLIRFIRHHTHFHNPIFASLSLNSPGKKHSIRLHRKTSLRTSLYLGITLVARAVKLTQELEAFLQTSNDILMTIVTAPNINQHIATLRCSCRHLIQNIFHGIKQMSTGSTMPRFYLLHGGYRGSMPDIVQSHPAFHSLFSTAYASRHSELSRVARHDSLIPTESQIAARSAALRIGDPALSQAFSVWHQLSTPRLPFWYHTTRHGALTGILTSGKIEVRHRAISGAFLSTKIESSYGQYTFAFSQETPLRANTFNKTSSSPSYLWHGSKSPIPLSPHLVAISYLYDNKTSLFSLLSRFGKIHENGKRSLAFFDYQGQLVFLFTRIQLISIQKIITDEGAKLAKSGPIPALPFPAHLMLDRVSRNCIAAREEDCQPLKQQLADNHNALSCLEQRHLIR